MNVCSPILGFRLRVGISNTGLLLEPAHRRLRGPVFPLHDPSAQKLHDEFSFQRETLPYMLDWGHQNGIVLACSGPASIRS